jgi:hypothetical protein
MNDKLNNEYPVPQDQELLLQSFVVNNLLLFYLAPLFSAVSYFAYATDMARLIEKAESADPLYVV